MLQCVAVHCSVLQHVPTARAARKAKLRSQGLRIVAFWDRDTNVGVGTPCSPQRKGFYTTALLVWLNVLGVFVCGGLDFRFLTCDRRQGVSLEVSVLQCVQSYLVWCSVVQCVAVCCHVLQCVAM